MLHMPTSIVATCTNPTKSTIWQKKTTKLVSKKRFRILIINCTCMFCTVALSLNPGDQVCIKYCADVLGKQGKTEEALKYFETQLDHK